MTALSQNKFKNSLGFWGIAVSVALGFTSCSGHQTVQVSPERTSATASAPVEEEEEEEAAVVKRVEAVVSAPLSEGMKQTDPLYEKASTFDRYLSGKLDLEDAQTLIKSCHGNPSENIFCFSVTNYDLLEEKLKAAPPLGGPFPPRQSKVLVRPRFKKKKLLNWPELRGASVAANLKGMAAISPVELMKAKQHANSEKKCPNNAAIAIAATLEDLLPDRIDYAEIARLYEKGAECITNNPADRENLLTRAGLFYFAKRDYKTAARVFQNSSEIEKAFVARPLYWLYRCRMELKQKRKATAALDLLKQKYPFSFHALIALTASNRDPGEILSRTQPVAIRRSQKEPTVNSLIEQVEILHRLGFEASASRVLDWAINDFVDVEPELKVYLAELKKEQKDYKSKIIILSDILYKFPALISRRTMELYFPKVLFPIFEKNSSGLDPYLLLAIARRESAFNHRAISSANARGLMQVMPATGAKISKGSNLLDPEDNVHVGSKYIFELLKKMNGQIHMALAAYNAGPLKLNAWSRRYEVAVDDPILFTDLIPFRETREYVASVLRNYYWYRRIHQGDEKITTQRLLELAKSKLDN